jgi:hypothetical protein
MYRRAVANLRLQQICPELKRKIGKDGMLATERAFLGGSVSPTSSGPDSYCKITKMRNNPIFMLGLPIGLH